MIVRGFANKFLLAEACVRECGAFYQGNELILRNLDTFRRARFLLIIFFLFFLVLAIIYNNSIFQGLVLALSFMGALVVYGFIPKFEIVEASGQRD